MASIENRSRFVDKVANCEELTQTFAYNRESALKAYLDKLKSQGYKPKLSHTDDSFATRMSDQYGIHATCGARACGRGQRHPRHVAHRQVVPIRRAQGCGQDDEQVGQAAPALGWRAVLKQ